MQFYTHSLTTVKKRLLYLSVHRGPLGRHLGRTDKLKCNGNRIPLARQVLLPVKYHVYTAVLPAKASQVPDVYVSDRSDLCKKRLNVLFSLTARSFKRVRSSGLLDVVHIYLEAVTSVHYCSQFLILSN